MEFNEKDVIIIAKALTADPIEMYELRSPGHSKYWCLHCDAYIVGSVGLDLINAKANFKHDIDCPVLIAQDILTNAI